jgi:hypothetical protein
VERKSYSFIETSEHITMSRQHTGQYRNMEEKLVSSESLGVLTLSIVWSSK